MNALLNKNSITKLVTLTMGLGLSFSLLAEAGTSIFTYGQVQLKNSQGQITVLTQGSQFETGDSILTGVNGRAQLKMKDGAIFDLKPNTEFLIEDYNYSASTNSTVVVAQEENKGFYKLVRGGFRAISGLIGKRNKKNYRVTTPVATIGIRGTDYTATLCVENCGANGIGLYLGVAEGGVVLVNDAGSLDIDLGQAGFVSNAGTAPVVVSSSALPEDGGSSSVSDVSGNSDETLVERLAFDSNGNLVNLETGRNVVIDQPIEPVPPTGVPGQVVTSIGGNFVAAQGADANLELGTRNALNTFTSNGDVYSINSASINNQGFDSNTGLYWGRWSNGSASVSNTDGSVNVVDLNNSSAHWVLSTNTVTPVLPSTGSASFNLIGNTNPTDNLGNSGVLGSADFSADFNSQTVDAEVNLTIADRTWEAEAENVALDGDASTFAGDFDSVEVTDNATGQETDGTGSLEGFFTGDDQGDLEGAGLVYNLEDGNGVEVEGGIVFEVDDVDNRN